MLDVEKGTRMETERPKPASVRFLSASGATIMEVEHIARKDDRLLLQGKMMGEFPQDVYLGADQFLPVLRMTLRPGLLAFLLLTPAREAARLVRSRRLLRNGDSGALLLSFLLAALLASPLLLGLLAVALALAPAVFLGLLLAAAVARLFGTRSS